jgi:hypothetical protein
MIHAAKPGDERLHEPVASRSISVRFLASTQRHHAAARLHRRTLSKRLPSGCDASRSVYARLKPTQRTFGCALLSDPKLTSARRIGMLSATVSAGAQNGLIFHKVKTEGTGDQTPSSVVEHCAAATLSLCLRSPRTAHPASLGPAGAATPSVSRRYHRVPSP